MIPIAITVRLMALFRRSPGGLGSECVPRSLWRLGPVPSCAQRRHERTPVLAQGSENRQAGRFRKGGAERDREFAEILVEGYQYLAVLRRMPKNLLIARVSTPITDPLYFMPVPLQLIPCAGPDAAIEQELQAASSVMAGSMRS